MIKYSLVAVDANGQVVYGTYTSFENLILFLEPSWTRVVINKIEE